MTKRANHTQALSDFLHYLSQRTGAESDRIPSLIELSQQLGLSVATLREQLEVARTLGLLQIKPRTGIQKIPYSFTRTLATSINYALAENPANFSQIADLRRHLESAYWMEAASKLTHDDIDNLYAIIDTANRKLKLRPPQIPHPEHKRYHLMMYQKLANPFVLGMLEAYWQAYETMGYDVYADMAYLEKVWSYHQRTVDQIAKGELDAGYKSFFSHLEMINNRVTPSRGSNFE
jgi:DNA-binding FadR family transcriptional regulator